jgi:UDPglucose--hexose-1-phosphate uridylyltransferase
LPELRIDPLSGLKVIVAGERGARPGAWLDVAPRPRIDRERDPFCEGHEDQTPPEIYALREDGRWRVRVVPNLYPALAPGEPLGGEAAAGGPGGQEPLAGGPSGRHPGARGAGERDPLAAGRGEPDLFAARPALGAHEVIVNAPDPVHSLAELRPEQVETAMSVWRARMREHADAAYVHVIVNEGREAGASLPHTHAQLYALPFVPAQVARERERFTAYSDRTQGRNLLEDLVQEEVRRGDRLVAVDDEAVALCPFGARVPFHVQIAPRRPVPRFSDDGPLGAWMVHQALTRLGAALGALPPLNMWVRTAPRDAERFCWRIEIMPRLAQLAGLEMGAGVHLNVLAPEDAALRLREATV